MTYELYSTKDGAGSPFYAVKQAIVAIQNTLEISEPLEVAVLAATIERSEAITRTALAVMQERLEVLITSAGWIQVSTVRAAMDPLGPKAQMIYAYLQTNPGMTLAGIVSGVGYSTDLTQHIINMLWQTFDVFQEADTSGELRYATRETATAQLTNTKLMEAYTDITQHEGTSLEALASRLYPSMAEGPATAITVKVMRCLLRSRGITRLP